MDNVYVLEYFFSNSYDDYIEGVVGVFSSYETLHEEIELMTKNWGEYNKEVSKIEKHEGQIRWGSWFKTKVLTYYRAEIDRPKDIELIIKYV